MERLRQAIADRIVDYELLLCNRPTPLLREQIRHAMMLHQEALKQPDVDPYIRDLDTLHNRLTEHWNKIHKNMNSRLSLIMDMILFQKFLVAKLLEDYTNESYTASDWVLDRARDVTEQERCVKAMNNSRVNNNNANTFHFIYPLEEMMLNRDHIESKLRAIGAREGQPGSDVQPLINQCDWSNLATTLLNDHDLTVKLCEGDQSDTNLFSTEVYASIFQGISEMKKLFFTEINSSSAFTISAYAKEMSARQTSNHTSRGSTPASPSGTQGYSETSSPKSSSSWIYNAVTTSLEGLSSSFMTRRYPVSSSNDEIASLVDAGKVK